VHLISRHQDQLNSLASSLHAPPPGVGGGAVDGTSGLWVSARLHARTHSADRFETTEVSPSLLLFPKGTVGFTDVDVTDTAALEAAIKGMGKLQGLAYCVGSIALKPLKATTTDDFVKVGLRAFQGLAVALCARPRTPNHHHHHHHHHHPKPKPKAFMLNTVGAATAVRAALPGMMAHYKETGTAASIVLFSSVAVQQGFPNHAIIGAVKGAFVGGSVGIDGTGTETTSLDCLDLTHTHTHPHSQVASRA